MRTCVGGSGAARPELAESVRRALAQILPAPIDVVGDMEIALEAAFGCGAGVVVIAGTGSIAYGRDGNGTTVRAGGWGFAISDEGSAHWIGHSAVRSVLRAADAAGTASEKPNGISGLATMLFKAWGVASFFDLARAANSIPPPDFAALFSAVATSGDGLAKEVLTSAGKELARLAAVVTGRLFDADGPQRIPVAMSGGVFRHAAVVCDVFYNELRALDSRTEIIPAIIDPVDGALRLARRAAQAVIK